MELEELHCVKIHDDAKKNHSTIGLLETYMYAFFDYAIKYISGKL